MILPGSHALAIAILILGMLCLGSWANSLKLAGSRWRFELFYIDFAVGVLIAAIVFGFTFGSMGWDGFSLIDNLRLAGKRQELFAFVAGCIFNLANILFVAAISMTGLAISFPVLLGTALVVGSLTGLIIDPKPSVPITVGGCAIIFAAVVCAVLAWRGLAAARLAAAPDRVKAKAPKKQFGFKGIIVAVVGGLVMGSYPPILGIATSGDLGLGPYSVCVVFAVGVFISTLVFDLFFMNLPLQGKPVEMGDYLKGGANQHLMGLFGGILWLTGILASLVGAKAEGAAHVGARLTWMMSHAPVLLAALWGIFAWKEFAGTEGRVMTLVAAALFLYLGGIAVFSIAY
jgi:glucose uptake protein